MSLCWLEERREGGEEREGEETVWKREREECAWEREGPRCSYAKSTLGFPVDHASDWTCDSFAG